MRACFDSIPFSVVFVGDMAAQSQLESHPLFLEAVESVLRCELAGLLSSDSYHPPAKPQMSTQDESL